MFTFIFTPQIVFFMLIKYSCTLNVAWAETWSSFLDDTSQKYLDPEKRILNINYLKHHRPHIWHHERASIVTLRQRTA